MQKKEINYSIFDYWTNLVLTTETFKKNLPYLNCINFRVVSNETSCL